MTSRSEYFLSLASEVIGFDYFNIVGTGISVLVFATALISLLLRNKNKDQAMANLPLAD